MTVSDTTTTVRQEIAELIAANGDRFARWLNGELDRNQITEITDLFTGDALMANTRLPDGVAHRDQLDDVMFAWRGLYQHDPVRSTVRIESVLEIGDDAYLSIHVRHLENSVGVTSNPETTLFVRDANSGTLKIRVIAE